MEHAVNPAATAPASLRNPAGRRAAPGFLRHPLVQFFLIGAVLFGIYDVLNPGSDPLSRRITVKEGEVRWLASTFANQFGHDPSRQELESLVSSYVDDEMKVREALAMGLDRDDTVVRRRLIQKYDFIASPAVPPAPAEAVLRKWYADHRASYFAPPLVSFCQVYVAPEPDRATAVARARTVAAMLQRGEKTAGDPIDLEPCETGASADAVAREYGAFFAKALGSVPVNTWTGPVESGFGFHAVKVTARGTHSLIPFDQARSQVLSDWQRAAQLADRARQIGRLRQRYQVSIDQTAIDQAAKGQLKPLSANQLGPMPGAEGDEGGE